VRSLVVGMHEDPDSWLKFAALCRKNGRPRQARQMLVALLRYDPRAIPSPGAGSGGWWSVG
jgi:FKBP12-rapamycin complex-associated protein